MDKYAMLNDRQREAVFCTEGPLLILAGAGAGKTRVLTHRIAYLIEEKMVSPYNILAITFTNKAAQEMKERVQALVDFGDSVWVATFHSTCVRILRRYIDRLGYDTDFTIYDADDAKSVVKNVIKDLNFDPKMYKEKAMASYISACKNEMLTPEDMMADAGSDFRKKKEAEIYAAYQKRCKQNNALDFDDLLLLTVQLFQENADVLDFYQERFRYILIDEYQDTNRVQFEFVSLLAKKYRNICVVGDDDQSIYKFRGADIRNILDFEYVFKGAKVVKLTQNYRSTTSILDCANSVISHNRGRKDKQLWSDLGTGDAVQFNQYENGQEEAAEVIRRIFLEVKNGGMRYQDYAILYRTNAQSRAFEEACMFRDIPYRLVGGVNFYQRAEIKDLLAYLKVIASGKDDVAVQRIINVPKRGIGQATVDRLQAFALNNDLGLMEAIENSEYVPGVDRARNKLAAFAHTIGELRELAGLKGRETVMEDEKPWEKKTGDQKVSGKESGRAADYGEGSGNGGRTAASGDEWLHSDGVKETVSGKTTAYGEEKWLTLDNEGGALPWEENYERPAGRIITNDEHAGYLRGAGEHTVSGDLIVTEYEENGQKMRRLERSLQVGFDDLIREIIDRTDYYSTLDEFDRDKADQKRENIDELISKARDFMDNWEGEEAPELADFLENVALVADIDSMDDSEDRVVLMTLHGSKGLEFPTVFLCGMEDGLFPSYMSLNSGDWTDVEEERRLCYVGITRAKQHLYLSAAKCRTLHGELTYNMISRFINEIPDDMIELSKKADRRFIRKDGLESGTGGSGQRSDRFGGSGTSSGGFDWSSGNRQGAQDSAGSGRYEANSGGYGSRSGVDFGYNGRDNYEASFDRENRSFDHRQSSAERRSEGFGSFGVGRSSYDRGYGGGFGASGSFGSSFDRSAPAPEKKTVTNKKETFGKTFEIQKDSSLGYGIGDRVRHIKFGEGTVTDIVDGKKDYEVAVLFDEVGEKRMFASFAKLKKVE